MYILAASAKLVALNIQYSMYITAGYVATLSYTQAHKYCMKHTGNAYGFL
jgi:hypothetical protein